MQSGDYAGIFAALAIRLIEQYQYVGCGFTSV
jgi:hypothetical protein